MINMNHENDNMNRDQMSSMFQDVGVLAMDLDQPSAYFTQDNMQQLPRTAFQSIQQPTSEYPTGAPQNWDGLNSHTPHSYMPHQFPPTSARSSASSNIRLSDNSVFSNHQWRGSVASTNTTSSTFSQSSKEHYISQAQHTLNANSIAAFQRSTTPLVEPGQILATYRSPQRPVEHPKNHLLTCVSRTKRNRPPGKESRYWCTSCHEGFREKYDWKRHEETYQERSETYHCDLCRKPYFLEKDFIHHHRESHRCLTCREDKHADRARRRRPKRTGWGCGFCEHFDTDWADRINHVAKHFENGSRIAKWSQTRVIYSLLRRPCLWREWLQLLESNQEMNPRVNWEQREAGRAENNPDSDGSSQLQDLLEFYTADQNPATLVALAYEMNLERRVEIAPPPVPPKDAHALPGSEQRLGAHRPGPVRQNIPLTANLPTSVYHEREGQHTREQGRVFHDQNMGLGSQWVDDSVTHPPRVFPQAFHHTNEFEHWHPLISTVREDDILADNMPIDFSELELGTLDIYAAGHQHHNG